MMPSPRPLNSSRYLGRGETIRPLPYAQLIRGHDFAERTDPHWRNPILSAAVLKNLAKVEPADHGLSGLMACGFTDNSTNPHTGHPSANTSSLFCTAVIGA